MASPARSLRNPHKRFDLDEDNPGQESLAELTPSKKKKLQLRHPGRTMPVVLSSRSPAHFKLREHELTPHTCFTRHKLNAGNFMTVRVSSTAVFREPKGTSRKVTRCREHQDL